MNGYWIRSVGIFMAGLPAFAAADVTGTINGAQNVKAISPLIYGTNQTVIPSTNDRLGGNRWSAYNWENNASNAGKDYRYQNDGFLAASNTPGAAVLPTLQANANNGHATVLTVPIIGHVAADKKADDDVRYTNGVYNPNYLSTRFKYGQAVKGSAFTLTPDTTDGVVYQDEFVNWVNANKSSTQQVMYSLDNEPGLWDSTHPEVHAGTTYAEVISKNIEYAKAIKSVSPTAKVLGAVSYGWTEMRSLQNASDANGRDFQATYLAAMKSASDAAGRRLVDDLDFHYYSEARGTNGVRVTENDPATATAAATAAARVQAPRGLWDKNFIENSYIQDTLPRNGIAGKAIQLLPRTQSLIDQNYAGTGMSVSEYNFGGGDHISGGIAQADTLGIFADQGVYSANWWDLDNGSTFVNAAQRMYLDYDGHGGHFGNVSVGSTVSDDGTASIHAAVDSTTGFLTLVLINKSDTAQTLALSLANLGAYTAGRAYRFDGSSAVSDTGFVQIARLADFALANPTAFSFATTPLSVTTVVLTPEPGHLTAAAASAGLLVARRRAGRPRGAAC